MVLVTDVYLREGQFTHEEPTLNKVKSKNFE